MILVCKKPHVINPAISTLAQGSPFDPFAIPGPNVWCPILTSRLLQDRPASDPNRIAARACRNEKLTEAR